jgi:hypothetical protein
MRAIFAPSIDDLDLAGGHTVILVHVAPLLYELAANCDTFINMDVKAAQKVFSSLKLIGKAV